MNAQLAALKAAADGLLLQSETDAPFAVFWWRRCEWDNFLTEAAKGDLRIFGTEELFEPLEQIESWMSETEELQVAAYRALHLAIQAQLPDARVWQLGEQVYICGRVECGVGGLKTQKVET